MSNIAEMSNFHSSKILDNNLSNLQQPDLVAEKMDRENILAENSVEKLNNELILTKATNAKTSKVTKNGRLISRVMEIINRININESDNKTNQVNKNKTLSEFEKNQMRHNRSIFNIYMYWYVVMLNHKSLVSNDEVNDKIKQITTLFDKFDTTDESYLEYLKYLQNNLGENLEKLFMEYRINNSNYMYKNFIKPDVFGFSTFYPDKFFTYDDIFDNKMDKEEKNVTLYRKFSNYSEVNQSFVDKTEQNNTRVPKIIHMVYYKNKIDKKFLYKVIKSFQFDDYQIIIWFNEVPEDFKTQTNIVFNSFAKYYSDYICKYGNNPENNMFKFMIKYYILQEYGGIYVDIKNNNIKMINNELLKYNFISMNQKRLENTKYIYPLGDFIGFVPNHPFVKFIIDNFEDGFNMYKTEPAYLRGVLYNVSDSYIQFLYVDPNVLDNNQFYITNYTIDEIDTYEYFKYDDFNFEKTKTQSNDSDMLLNEISEIEQISNKILTQSKPEPNNGFWMMLLFILSTLFSMYLFQK